MSSVKSPLRYPGGKAKLYDFVKRILVRNDLIGGTYVEPFAGGAGLALRLLLNNDVKRIIINDLDPAIYNFWYTIINNAVEFCDKIKEVDITVDEWKKQKEIYSTGRYKDQMEYAFAVFFLNRTNISGVLNGGPIGGMEQNGNYKIDARFNKDELIKKIVNISNYKDRIIITNCDAKSLIQNGTLNKYKKVFINFDPPYVKKGARLYKNSFQISDHTDLYNCILNCKKKWIVTYDICPLITDLYSRYRTSKISINYSVRSVKKAQEYVFFSDNLILPEGIN